MNPGWIAFSVALLSLAIHPVQRFTSGVDLVTVDVLVSDGRRPVAGLRADDFDLLDSGVPQSIEMIDLARQPLNLILVLDTSGSVAGQRLADLQEAATWMIDALHERDRASIVSFSHRLALPSPLTADKTRLREAVASLRPQGSTTLRDAVFAGIALRGRAAGRTLLVVFSDGVDNSSFLSGDRISMVVRRSDVVLYGVTAPDPWQLAPIDDRFLKHVSEETGGRVLPLGGRETIQSAFSKVLDEFRNRYVLAYTPAGVPRDGWHSIEVRLKRQARRGTVTARRGYFAR